MTSQGPPKIVQIHMRHPVDKHMDGARDIFWIKSLNGTFLALQIKAYGPKKF